MNGAPPGGVLGNMDDHALPAAPTRATETPTVPGADPRPGRIGSLDAIRGLALAGIAFVNIPTFWRLQIDPDFGPNNVWDILQMFVQQRFFPIFSLLFGIGFGLMWHVARKRAARPRTVMLRRFAFLFLLGFGHQFLQGGEALLPYSIVALLVLLPATFLPERRLGPVTATAGVALTAVALALDGGLIAVPGLFLLGFALALYDVPRILDGNLRANGIILVAATIASAGTLHWQNTDPMAPGFSPSSAVAGLAMATMYMALLNVLMSTPLRGGVLAVFAPLGRMSLTNYIAASALFLAAIPLRPLIGAEGDSPAAWATAMGVVAVILVAQWVFSALWLRYFRQGPLEWVWRRVTWAGAKPLP